MTEYLFDRSAESRRLDALAALHDRDTFTGLERLGIAVGWRCLEVGAGSGTVARWMATRVGDRGRVVATDLHLRGLEQLAGDGIEVREHDIGVDRLEERAFDLIHARAVLQHVRLRAAALECMVRALKPGGVILIEDVVTPQAACHPELPAWSKIVREIERQLRLAGANPYYGLELDGALRSAGLVDVRCEAFVSLMHSGTPSMEVNILSLEQIGPRLLAAGHVTADDIEVALRTFRSPGCTLTSAVMVAASGRASG